MLSPKLILILIGMTTLELTVVSGLKCILCGDNLGPAQAVVPCRKPDSSKFESSPPNDKTPSFCTITLIYKDNNRGQPPISVDRTIGTFDPTGMQGKMKEIGIMELPACDDVSKFPALVSSGDNSTYQHGCICKKDLCNSVIIPEK